MALGMAQVAVGQREAVPDGLLRRSVGKRGTAHRGQVDLMMEQLALVDPVVAMVIENTNAW